jgi:hypothetical protein
MSGVKTETGSLSSTSEEREGECPLCGSAGVVVHHSATRSVPWQLYAPSSAPREALLFYRCSECELILKDPAVRPTPEQERAHYAKHNNDIRDGGYRSHLCRLLDPVLAHVPKEAIGLDYGCGPSVSIEVLARERGIECRSYDPHFVPESAVLRDSYHFITCSEVAEHFARPAVEFERLCGMLKEGGVLGVMTQLIPDTFADWWYHRDPTHLVFYSPRTFSWIAQRHSLNILERCEGVVVFQK